MKLISTMRAVLLSELLVNPPSYIPCPGCHRYSALSLLLILTSSNASTTPTSNPYRCWRQRSVVAHEHHMCIQVVERYAACGCIYVSACQIISTRVLTCLDRPRYRCMYPIRPTRSHREYCICRLQMSNTCRTGFKRHPANAIG